MVGVDLADERRLRVAYLGHSITGDVNRTRYQRPKHLATMADLYLFVKRDTHVPEEIGSKASVVRSRFGAMPLYVLWSVYKVWKLDKRVHFDLVYALYPVHYLASNGWPMFGIIPNRRREGPREESLNGWERSSPGEV